MCLAVALNSHTGWTYYFSAESFKREGNGIRLNPSASEEKVFGAWKIMHTSEMCEKSRAVVCSWGRFLAEINKTARNAQPTDHMLRSTSKRGLPLNQQVFGASR